MNVDPAATGKFFKKFLTREGFSDYRVVPALCEAVSMPATERAQALHLHIMRVLTTVERLGDPEGALFERQAFDVRRPIPVRCWAFHACANTSSWSANGTMEFVEAEGDSRVRRAAVLSMTKRASGRRVRRFLDHLDRLFPDIRITTAYVRRAA